MRLDDLIDLSHVHPVLAATVCLAASRVQLLKPDTKIRVTSGYRTESQQRALVKSGASRTMNSLHRDGLAVDLAIIRNGLAVWDFEAFRELNGFMQKAFREVSGGIETEGPRSLFWGGAWITLRDGPHWELHGFDAVAV